MTRNSQETPLKLFGYTELSEILGMSPNTLRHWVSQKRIPYTKIGGCVRWTEVQIQQIIDSGRQEAEGGAQ